MMTVARNGGCSQRARAHVRKGGEIIKNQKVTTFGMVGSKRDFFEGEPELAQREVGATVIKGVGGGL